MFSINLNTFWCLRIHTLKKLVSSLKFTVPGVVASGVIRYFRIIISTPRLKLNNLDHQSYLLPNLNVKIYGYYSALIKRYVEICFINCWYSLLSDPVLFRCFFGVMSILYVAKKRVFSHCFEFSLAFFRWLWLTYISSSNCVQSCAK